MSEHTKAWEQIPWLVNGSLQGEALRELQQHVSSCGECRAEVALQSRLREAMAAQPAIEFAPQASLNRLWERIEAESQLQHHVTRIMPRRYRRWFVYGVAAQWVLMVGMAWWYVHASSADYRTVTSQSAAPAGEFKVVFYGGTTVGEINALLDRAGLESINGPTPSGVFVLSRDAQHGGVGLDTALAQLRADPHVRFAERTSAE